MFTDYQPKKGYDEYFSSEDFSPRTSLEPLLSSLGKIGLDQLNILQGILDQHGPQEELLVRELALAEI